MTSGGKAKISWLMKDLLNTTHRMNSTATSENGWPATEMRTWLRETILPTIDSGIRSHIVEVDKSYVNYTTRSTLISTDTIWLPSIREIFGVNDKYYENTGIIYDTIFSNQDNIIKELKKMPESYWLRSGISTNTTIAKTSFHAINEEGSLKNNTATGDLGICIGFCTN